MGKMLHSKTESKVRSIQLVSTGGREQEAGLKAIQSWLKHVNETYTTRKAEFSTAELESGVEQLMAQWPVEMDQALTSGVVSLPPPDMDLTLKQYLQICCNILDIPVLHSDRSKKKNRHISAAGQICMLYSGFKNSQHFGIK